MTIQQLEYLNAVAIHGNFSTAADFCFVTQPSLSTQIKNLEQELGVVLLNRAEKPIVLTEAGRLVVDQSREAISAFYRVKEVVSEMKNEVKGTLRLAVIPTIAPYLVHLFLPKFMAKYPEVRLEIKEMFTRDIIKALSLGSVDIALLAGGFTDKSEIDEEVIFKDKFTLYVSSGHTFYGKESVSVREIDSSELILLSEGHCLRDQIVDLCSLARGKRQGLRFESGSMETIMRMVDATGKTTIIPQMAAQLMGDSKNIIPITSKGAERDISLAVSKRFYKQAIYNALKDQISNR